VQTRVHLRDGTTIGDTLTFDYVISYGEVSQCGHGLRPASGVYLLRVLVLGGVTNVVALDLNSPVMSNMFMQVTRGGVGGRLLVISHACSLLIRTPVRVRTSRRIHPTCWAWGKSMLSASVIHVDQRLTRPCPRSSAI
jgi:hypothetical protein